MKRIFSICAFIFISLLSSAQVPVIEITDDLGFMFIGDQVQIFTDTTGELNYAQIKEKSDFLPCPNPVPNLGLTDHTHWIRFQLRNKSSLENVKISIANPEIEDIKGFVEYSNGRMEIVRTGQLTDPRDSKEKDIDPTISISLAPDELISVYFSINSRKQLLLPITLSSPQALANERSNRDTIMGIYIGIMLVLLFYNLFIYASTRDRNYLIYVAYIALVAMTQLVFLGFGKFHLWPSSTWFAVNASVIFTVLTAVAANEFMCAFIHVKEYTPRLAMARFWLYAVMGIGLMLRLTTGSAGGYQILQLVVMLSAVYQFIVGVNIAMRGSRPARYFLAAWSVFLLGIILFVLKDMHVLPYTNFTKYTMTLGTAIEGILLSLALADRINVLRKEKELSQAESLRISKENERIIREQNVILEERVRERTHALQESNENLKQTQTQLVNAEKMASLGQLTAGIAHEINNPINFITSNIKPLRRNIGEIVEVMQEYRNKAAQIEQLGEIRRKEEQLGIQDSIDELDDIINSIAEGSSRTAEIVRGLRNFSRLDESDLKNSDINEGLRNTITVLGPQYRDRVRIETDLQEIPQVECFPGKVNQVFMNILTNAVQATLAKEDADDRIVSIATRSSGDHVIISIKDNGTGMSDEVKAHIYDPFFTTKPVGEGTGLGMAIVYGIIEDHHGSIEIDSTPGIGTEFRIALPISHMQLNERRA